jgi:hypothetical protein
MIAHCLVGFLDEQLVASRHGHDSETIRNGRSSRAWLDALWTYESLWPDPEVRACYPELAKRLRAERRQTWPAPVAIASAAGSAQPSLSLVLRYN